jgi:hypothetical protein
METTTIYEKEDCLVKLDEAFSSLKEYALSAAGHTQIHVAEKEIFRRLIALGLLLLKAFIQACGTGYQPPESAPQEEGKPLPFKGIDDGNYFSIFGELSIARARYRKPSGKYCYPLDQQLNLPEEKYSYLLQQWLQGRAVISNYREAVDHLNEMLGFSLAPSVSQRLGKKLGEASEAFNQNLEAPAPETEGACLAISADGKGVRIVKSERPGPSSPAEPKARLGKGEKPGIKKEAVVTVDFSFHPGPRNPEEIVKSLLNEMTAEERQEQKCQSQANDQPRTALNKHLRTTLDGKEDAMAYLMARIKKRDPFREKPVIVLLDGDPNLENALDKALTADDDLDRVDAKILDIIHATEYVWDAATALYGEKNKAARLDWVRDKLLAILSSNVGRVIGGLKQIMTKNKLSNSQKHALQKAITYFNNHRHMMDYADYLAKGYPIATGLVEASCNSVVKDRMEQSGMRWTIKGAESLLRQRVVYLNNDWRPFWETYISTQKEILYADSYRKAA